MDLEALGKEFMQKAEKLKVGMAVILTKHSYGECLVEKGAVGRIIELVEINETFHLPSAVRFSTPHGTVIRSGLAWIDIVEAGSEEETKLEKYEQEATEIGDLYNGELENVDWRVT